MLQFLPFALQALSAIVPQLGELFPGGDVAQRNVKAAGIVLEAAKTAVGAANEQDLIEKIQNDPEAAAAVKQAVGEVWYQVVEAGGGGIAGARAANDKALLPGAPGFWQNPAFWISAMLMAMPFMLLVDVFYVHPDSYDGNLRTQIVTGVLVIVGMVGAYWLGTSASSAKKTELLASR
jgi:hypothetical protein